MAEMAMQGVCVVVHSVSVCAQAIIRAFRSAGALAVQHVRDAAVSIGGKDPAELRSLLQKCAATSLNSKLVRAAVQAGATAQTDSEYREGG